MNIKATIRKLLTDACVLFSLITAAYALITYLIYVNQDKVLIDAGQVLLFFIFSLLVSGANTIFRQKSISGPFRLLAHFLICTLAFYLCCLLPLNMPATTAFVGVILFVIAYFIAAGIWAGIASRFRKNRDESGEYQRQYTQKSKKR